MMKGIIMLSSGKTWLHRWKWRVVVGEKEIGSGKSWTQRGGLKAAQQAIFQFKKDVEI